MSNDAVYYLKRGGIMDNYVDNDKKQRKKSEKQKEILFQFFF